jgi:single-stranded DNA-binding protein
MTDIVADEVQFLSTRNSNENENSESKTMTDLQPVDEEVPF